jgi:hypothetical protein
MRALTFKEKKLLAVLLGAIFLLVNVVGLQAFLQRQRDLQKSIAQLESQLVLNRAVLAEKPLWEERAAWLDQHQPEDDTSTTEDDSKFYDFVEKSAQQSGLQFTRKSVGSQLVGGLYAEVSDTSQVKGNMESLVKWLHELQQPKAFRAIKQISIKSGEPPEVVCEIELARWFRATEENQP